MMVKIKDQTFNNSYTISFIEALNLLITRRREAFKFMKDNNKECCVYAIKLYDKTTENLDTIEIYDVAITEEQLAERTTLYYKDKCNQYHDIQFCVTHNHK